MNERLYKALHEKHALQRFLARRLFGLFQRFGLHITGNHFYEIIPDTREVNAQYSGERRALPGIDWRFEECEQRAVRLVQQYGAEYHGACEKYGFREKNFYFRGLDALALYLVLRDRKPGKVAEIGQGFSTRIALAALERNAKETGTEVEFISLDPYDRFTRSEWPCGVNVQCVRGELQRIPLEPMLENCGFLFVDSSHVYKFGSDVEYEFARLYPALRKGTLVHLHDIFSPYQYPREWIVQEKRFWNEQYFLEAFLMFNDAFAVHLPVHFLSRNSAAFLEAVNGLALDEPFKRSGTSFYLERL